MLQLIIPLIITLPCFTHALAFQNNPNAGLVCDQKTVSSQPYQICRTTAYVAPDLTPTSTSTSTSSATPTGVSNSEGEADASSNVNVMLTNNLAPYVAEFGTDDPPELSNLLTPSMPPPGDQDLMNKGWYNASGGTVEYPNPTNVSIIINPLNLSVADISPDILSQKRRSIGLQPRVLPGGIEEALLSNGMYVRAYLGIEVARNIFEVATDVIWDQVNDFVSNHEQMTSALEFFAGVQGANRAFDFYAFTMGYGQNSVPSGVVQLLSQALYSIMDADVQSGVARDVPRLLRSYTLYAADRVTPIIIGYFRETY